MKRAVYSLSNNYSFHIKKEGNTICKIKGNRIKPCDSNLLYHTGLVVCGVICLLVMAIFLLRSLMRTDWKTITLEEVFSQFYTPSFLGSALTAFSVCLLLGLLIYRQRIDTMKQLQLRKKWLV